MSSLHHRNSLLCCFVILLSSSVCVNCKPPTDVNEFLFSGALEFLDLSHPFDNDTSCIQLAISQRTFSKKSGGTKIEGIWFGDEEQCQPVYSGTHIDAPFYNATWAVGSIPFKNLINPLIVVDLNNYVAGNPDFVLERRHMDYLFHGDMRRNFTVLFRFGWSQHFGDKQKYLGGSHPEEYRYPGISQDVAEWISMNKNLIGVAVDTASVDPGSEKRGLSRKIFTDSKIFMIENVNLTQDLPRSRCSIIIMPMKFQDGTSAPCRVTAICPKLLGHGLF